MVMEQKKILWINLFVAMFLLVVFGSATLIYSSNTKNDIAAVSVKNSDALWVAPASNKTFINTNDFVSTDTFDDEPLQEPSVMAGLQTPQEGTTNLENGFTSGSSVSGVYQVPDAKTSSETKTDVTVISTNASSAKQRDLDALKNNESFNVTPKNETAQKALDQASTKTVAKSSTSSTAKKTVAKSSETKNTATTASVAQSAGTYWVQVSSYSVEKYADNARNELDKNKLPCEVFTTTVNGTLYYRVRVGPYKTQKEAENSKAKIDSIALFKGAGSRVVNTATEKK